ncbi:MAG: acyl transferase domain-containing protein, partial [Granulosicoccus sp.]
MSKELEPIAIVGIGCRFPGGAENPEKFWEVMNNGIDGIVDVPKDRWDERRFYDSNKERMGKSHAKQAGFLQSRIDEFDPLFFGISPREAAVLDPQQRLLLEMTWEAIDDAGIQEEKLRGSETGVFIGGFTLDNKLIQLGQLNREILSSNTATSSTMVMLSNRISYTFNLKGPSVSMDTACSSSLVAAHYACQSIWSGETDMAITGGANVMLTPEYPITMSKGQFLSDHSRCKAFDADAKGYVRGEGGGIVILKPLSKAEADGDFIYGTIRASGANQDGATQGITVPSKDSQSNLVKKVYDRAGVSTSDIGYIEAHGTGTKAGDPVEVGALSQALSGRDLEDKCYVGSVKTNIGHLEAGAGIAGLIKATLATHHRQIPPNLHFNNPNPNIDFDSIPLKVPTKVTEWPAAKNRAFASINSFGYGGTNAHVLVEGYKNDASQTATAKDKARLFPISARSEKALKQTAVNLLNHIKDSDSNLDDLHYSLAHRRSHHHNRLAIKANTMEELEERLSDWTEDRFAPGMITGTVQAEVNGKLVFVYTGMGPQWWAMGRQLLENEPVFRSKIEECDVIFKKIAGWSMIEELSRPEAESKIASTEIAQPTNFAIQIGLTALWKHWGITPDAVVGHSVGEVAAAYVSGALSLEDGLTVSYHRSRIQQKTAGEGKMLAIGLGEEEALKRLNGNPKISVAAVNSFQAITLAGDETALEAFGAELTKENIFNKMLRVEVAYHSYQMEPLKDELFESLSNIKANEPKITLYSTVTGEEVKAADFGTEYWWQNVRQPVRFAKAVTQIVADGYNSFVEVGPHPVTRQSINECLSAADVSGNVVCSLIRNENEENTMFESLSQLYTIGYEPNWDVLSPKANYVKLPSYAWQKEVYRHETDRSREYRLGTEGHIFLNDNLRQPEPAWEVELNTRLLPWLEDHQVEKAVVVPGAAYVEAGLAIHQKEFNDAACVLMDLKFNQVLVADPDKVQMMQTRYDNHSKTYGVYSREKGDTSGWQLHAKGRMLEGNFGEEGGTVNFNELKSGFNNSIEPADMYATLTNMGLYYGPFFQGLKQIYTRKDEVLCQITGKEELNGNPDQYLLHPTILDSAFQSMVSLVEEEGNTTPYVPVNIDKFVLYTPVGNSVWCHGTITERGKDSITGNIVFFNEEGTVLAKLTGLKCRALTNKKGPKETVLPEWFYGLEWKPAEETLEPTSKKMAVLAHDLSDQTMDLIGSLTEAGVDVSVIEKASSFEQTDLGWQLDMGDADQWKQLANSLVDAGIYRYSFLCDAGSSNTLSGT